jgi:hypothetical protein
MTIKQEVRAKSMELAIQYAAMLTKFVPPSTVENATDSEDALINWIIGLSEVFEKKILAAK